MKFEWGLIEYSTFIEETRRAKVHGGWIVLYRDERGHKESSSSMVFVPDPDHEWELSNEEF